MDRMISLVINMIMRQLISRGVNAGFDQASKTNKRGKKKSPKEHRQEQEGR